MLYELGFQAAVELLAESVQSQSGLTVSVEGNEGGVRLDIGRRVFLFQAVRELLFNVVKHAVAGSVTIRIVNTQDNVDIEVIDDGRGFDLSMMASQNEKQDPGFGLFSIREQLRYYGGQLVSEAESGKGTRVTITMPLETVV